MDKQERNIGLAIVLSIVTCGIYGIYWFITLNDEVKQKSKDATLASGGLAFVLTLVTCGIYGYYWAYRMGKATLVLYIILQFFGLAIVNYALIQNDMNAITSYAGKTKKTDK